MRRYVSKLVQQYAALQPLTLVLKQFLVSTPQYPPRVASVPAASYRQCALPSCRRVASEAGWALAQRAPGGRMRGATRPLDGATDTSASPGTSAA